MDSELKSFLDEKVETYNNVKFISEDPISIPHQFSKKEDIEISGFLTATIAWGGRKTIIKNAQKMINFIDGDPFNFVLNHEDTDLLKIKDFVHRTFNNDDFLYFIKALRNIYLNHQGLEDVFKRNQCENSLQHGIHILKQKFFEIDHPLRARKHISDPGSKSAAKRINMFLRWMIRKDKKGVDFGIWDSISPSKLSCPLDVHSGTTARQFGLLKRQQNDAKAVIELDQSLRLLDPADPVKYDFALFGLGAIEKF
jgi:uncharacterized protein (TIGR02757 family)